MVMELDLKKFQSKKICVAVSGGVDSVVLLRLLKDGEKEFGYTLIAVNFEHGIRGVESEKDSAFVAGVCKAWEVPLLFYKENCIERAKREKESLETAARNFRREKYERILSSGKADYIATAHHANDVAETVLFRICRGASLSGASGIKGETDSFIRPLIGKTKAEILDYAKAREIPYREDLTNFEREATRNVLRLDVLPVLEERISGATKSLARFAAIAAEDDRLLYDLSERLIERGKDGIEVAFSEQKPLFRRACLSAMKELGIEKDYTLTHLEDVFKLQGLSVGAKITLPKRVAAKKRKTGVFFYKDEDEEEIPTFAPTAFKEGVFVLGEYEVTVSERPVEGEKSLRLDREKLPENCVFRTRKEGDVFRKFGGGKTTLKRYFINKKIPRENRNLPLIAEENGDTVYAIFGVEIAEEVKVSSESKKIVYLTLKNTGEKNYDTSTSRR